MSAVPSAEQYFSQNYNLIKAFAIWCNYSIRVADLAVCICERAALPTYNVAKNQ